MKRNRCSLAIRNLFKVTIYATFWLQISEMIDKFWKFKLMKSYFIQNKIIHRVEAEWLSCKDLQVSGRNLQLSFFRCVGNYRKSGTFRLWYLKFISFAMIFIFEEFLIHKLNFKKIIHLDKIVIQMVCMVVANWQLCNKQKDKLSSTTVPILMVFLF